MIRLETKNLYAIKTAKVSALTSSKIDKYEYLTDQEVLHSNQSQLHNTSS